MSLEKSKAQAALVDASKIGKPRIPETDLDKGIVGWDGQDDAEMPLNFTKRRKWALLGLVSSITFVSPLASSIFAPGVEFMDRDFHNKSSLLSSFVVSVFVLGGFCMETTVNLHADFV